MKTRILITTTLLIFFSFSLLAQYPSAIKVEPLLKTDTTSMGQLIKYPVFKQSEVTISKITIPPGQSTGWHKHAFPVFATVLSGTLTVEFRENRILTFPTGSSFAEAIDLEHTGSNQGTENVVLMAVYLGEKGKPLSTHVNENEPSK